MLSKWDDYPIHQVALPVAQTASSDLGRYDRHWLSGHDTDLTTQIGFGLSVHPNRGIVDASLSIARDGHQYSTFGSAPLSRDRDMIAGPIRLEVVEPGRTLRIVAEEHDGVAADLTFEATTQHIEDSRMRRESGAVLVSERLRTVQFGVWSGSFSIDGKTVECTPESWWGFRDRSWGSRTTGTVAEGQGSQHKSDIYFAWTLLRFDDEYILAALNEDANGVTEARTVAALPYLRPGDPLYGEEHRVPRTDTFEFTIDYVPGSRRSQSVQLEIGPRGPIQRSITIEPKGLFLMQGLGYYHPKWKHGTDHGGTAVGSERWRVADIDPTRLEHVHVQQIARATRSDGAVGLGLFEHVAIGPHLPSGLPEGIVGRD